MWVCDILVYVLPVNSIIASVMLAKLNMAADPLVISSAPNSITIPYENLNSPPSQRVWEHHLSLPSTETLFFPVQLHLIYLLGYCMVFKNLGYSLHSKWYKDVSEPLSIETYQLSIGTVFVFV